MSPYVRSVKTASGARAVQIVYSWRKGARCIEHIGSAHDDAELAALKEVAWQRLNAGQLSLDLPGVSGPGIAGSGPQPPTEAESVAPITSNRMGVLLINDFMDAYNLDDVVVVADAGMISTRSVSLLMAVVISCYSSTYSDSPILICHVTPNRSTSCP
ncbi:transposase IS4 family protein [Actinomyces sp. Chiba101]|nr:transposase IS4 family protein [Actinomyces sp. Chiba101]GAV95110.1 transposase IS4 [Actinomyces denticolens]SUU12330.1 Uncharacterised protein [Actinomyces denticolens]